MLYSSAATDGIRVGVFTGPTHAVEPFLGVQPVARVDAAAPLQPQLSRSGGVQVVLHFEAQRASELTRTLSHDEMMIGQFGDRLCNERRRADTLDASYATRPVPGAVH